MNNLQIVNTFKKTSSVKVYSTKDYFDEEFISSVYDSNHVSILKINTRIIGISFFNYYNNYHIP